MIAARKLSIALLVVFGVPCCPTQADQVLLNGLRHLRIEGPREWSEFPQKAEGTHIDVLFQSRENASEFSIVVQQQDVKQRWNVTINGQHIGRLRVNEIDMRIYLPVPANVLRNGENSLRIEQAPQRNASPDDVRLGNIQLLDRPVEHVLSDASLDLTVLETGTDQPVPSRITVVNADGALQTVGAISGGNLAVRPGCIYTSDGTARIGLPAGVYTVYAGRGFEYSIDRIEVELAAGQTVARTLKLHREVSTEGLVACDTHVHTLTHSGHGDATVHERMITLAAEGIEMPVATDHNLHIDHRPFARQANVSQYFTPVIGNEVTSGSGHVNIFPVKAGASTPDHQAKDWRTLFDNIYATPDVRVAILNHPRDVHNGVTPFGPRVHNDAVGENLDGWHFGFNAMEVVNSSSTQNDILQLFHDWMAVLNRGHRVTPVGSSDSHDVGRHFVGQGRTYIRCDDSDPGNIDVSQAVDSFLQGRVLVSYGLLTKLAIDESFRSGETATADGDTVRLKVEVLGPHWTEANRVILYSNGQEVSSRGVSVRTSDLATGVKAVETFTFAKPKHDVQFVAIAIGPGIDQPFWKTAKPYQPKSPDWKPHVIGCSGAVRFDADGDGEFRSAHSYAAEICTASDGDLSTALKSLADFDEATAIQAAHLLQSAGTLLIDPSHQTAIRNSAPQTRRGIHQYLTAWRETEMARAAQ